MIYNSTITGVNESDIMELLENAETRFEDETMAEATAIVVGEQEINWTRFMQGVGLSELATIMEGEEVIYEGARFQKFVNKAKGFFQMILNKLAELTKAFVAKFDQFFKQNDAFVKKYRSALGKVDYAKADAEINGYRFQHTETPGYKNGMSGRKSKVEDASEIINNKDDYTREKAEDSFFGTNAPDEDTLGAKLNKWFYGDGKETIKLDNQYIDDQIKILEGTKTDRETAKKSYKEAAKEIKDIIKKLKEAERKFDSNVGKSKDSSEDNANVSSAFGILLSYWKAYGSAATQVHGAYLSMLGKRNRQAKAACVKALNAGGKAKGKEEREKIKARTEGFVDTEDFLAAVDFI